MIPKEAHRKAFADFKAGRISDAVAIYREIVKNDPTDARAWHFLGISEAGKNRFEEALAFQEKSLQLSPGNAEFHHNTGSTLRVLGRFEDAEGKYRRALELKPDYAEAYFNLSSTRRFTDVDTSDFEAVEKFWGRADLSEENRGFLGFAAGKMMDDIGRYDEAFAYYKAGNEARKLEFDRDVYSERVRRIREVFSADLISARTGDGLEDRRPIFVVGMPRSATTLVEQILSAHPLVTGAGELPDIQSIMGALRAHSPSGLAYPECVPDLPANVFPGFASAYLKTRAGDVPPEGRLVDKMPSNYLHLGGIALMFPGAAIVHCRRDPLDTCLSCYFQRFRAGHHYSGDLGDLGFVYRRHAEMMEFWCEALPREPFDLDYGELVSDQEGVTRRLVEYCGLPWDDACLHFHEVERPVATASNWQVRRPLNKRGLGRWKNYEKHLDPLRKALE